MMRKIFVFAMITVLIFTITACRIQEKKRYEAQFLILFDTVTQVIAYYENKDTFSEQVNQIYADLEKYHQLFDVYHTYPGLINIKTINEHAGKHPVKADPKIIDLLLFGKKVYKKTNGKVNIAFGSVLSLWHDYRQRGIADPQNAQLPPLGLLLEAAKHTDIDKILIDEKTSTVFLEDPRMSLDVGAIAKGYAVEQVSRKAIKRGFVSGLISVGGNVKIIGSKNSNKGEMWNIGIQNPDFPNEESNLYVLNLSDQSIVTSGTYGRYYTVEGKEYHHIIDPDTLYPAKYFISITVICEDSGQADVLSTALCNMPQKEGLSYIESLEDTEAFWLFPDGRQRFSSGFQKYLVK